MSLGEPSNIPSSRKNRLPKSRILRGKRNFQRLFDDSVLLRGQVLNLRYRLYGEEDERFLVGFIVRKALGKAVDRNRARRRIREAWRLHQHPLLDLDPVVRKGLHMAWMARRIDLTTTQAAQDIRQLSERLTDRLHQLHSSTPFPARPGKNT
ncbi:MAG: ribonuclease P protein component [Balneolaceae bacterium]